MDDLAAIILANAATVGAACLAGFWWIGSRVEKGVDSYMATRGANLARKEDLPDLSEIERELADVRSQVGTITKRRDWYTEQEHRVLVEAVEYIRLAARAADDVTERLYEAAEEMAEGELVEFDKIIPALHELSRKLVDTVDDLQVRIDLFVSDPAVVGAITTAMSRAEVVWYGIENDRSDIDGFYSDGAPEEAFGKMGAAHLHDLYRSRRRSRDEALSAYRDLVSAVKDHLRSTSGQA